MALNSRVRAKSARERRVIHEYSQNQNSGNNKDFVIGNFLESLSNVDRKTEPRISKSSTKKSGLTGKMKEMHNARSQPQTYSGKVANRSLRDMGAFSWTPLATRTAVGYGDSLYVQDVSSVEMSKRPESAPNTKMRRSGSLNSLDTMSSSSLTASLVTSHTSFRNKSRKGYMEEPITLCVQAFPNGTRERSVRVISRNLAQLLEAATDKLGLPSAGRRIFLPDGTLVNFVHQLYKDCCVYISMGEPFKDPYEALKENERTRLASSWTITGIVLPEDRSNSKKRTLSKRMKSLLENPKRRVLIFRNGESCEGAEVVANRFDELLINCTKKLDLTSSAQTLYAWNGSEVQSFHDLSKQRSENLVQSSQHGIVFGPVWASKGEPFNPMGAYGYIMGLAIDLKQRIKKEEAIVESFQNILSKSEDGKKPEEQLRKINIVKEITKTEAKLSSMKGTLKDLKACLKTIKTNSKNEVIPETKEYKRLDNTKGYRLRLRLNGSENSSAIILPFSSKDLRKGKKTKEEALQSFFDLLNNIQSLKESFIGHGRRAEFKRAFLFNGTEISDINEIDSDAEVWLSLGEDFVPIEYEILAFSTDKVKYIDYWNEKTIFQRQSWLGADEKLAKPSLWDVVTSLPTDVMKKEVIQESVHEDEKRMFVNTMNNERLRSDGVFFQNRKEPSLVLYPELQLIRKTRSQGVTFWGEDSNQWFLSQNGTIINKCFKNLALSVGDQEILIQDREQKIKGYTVVLALKKTSMVSSNEMVDGKQKTQLCIDPSQQWKLTPDGQIVSAMLPNFYLTNTDQLHVEKYQENVVKEDEGDANNLSLSSSSSSESSQQVGQGDTSDKAKAKKMKKRKKKDKKGEKKKWWNFDSSSSSSSDEDDMLRDKKKSSEDIKVRMKWTSSEDDKNETGKESSKIVGEEPKLGEEQKLGEEPKVDEKDGEEVVELASDLLKKMPDVYGGEKVLLGVFGKFEDKDPMKIRQRWAVKTEDASSLLSSATLSKKWLRQELTWPVNEANSWAEDSLSGCLLPCAPKLKRKVPKKDEPTSPFYGQPARLKVLRNGEHESTRAVVVVGPDLSNMKRRVRASLPLKWKKGNGSFQEVQSASVAEVEFEMFLDKCTDSLHLPFAARRLFDEKGKELTSVNALERDQLVYVSCGENWINPHVTFSEQQRRLLLANLASDVCKIRNYVMLRNQSDLILQVDGPLQAESCIALRKRPDDNELNSTEETESSTVEYQSTQENEIRELQNSYLSSHQIAHLKADERMQSIREQFQCDLGMVSNLGTGSDSEDDSPFSNPALARKFSSSPSAGPIKPPQNAFYQWIYQDGFIQLKANRKLVIGVQQSDESTSGQNVILCNKKVEDSFQRWVMSDLGFIHLKCNPQLVLAVATPSLQTDPFSDANQNSGYHESRIILGRRLDSYNGNSHQMFDIEVDTGYINAFSTDLDNIETTAAFKASVCTYSIFGSREVYQPGYSISEDAKPNSKVTRVCESCGKAVRGKLNLEKIKEAAKFSCAMGAPEIYGLTTNGTFKCLSPQIDLSQREADSTLLVWEGQLKRLQKESSVKVIAYELNLARTTPSVRILAHKNGDVGYSDGVTVIANSIHQFLDLCTYKLGLAQAARKLFMMSGEVVTDMSQLLQPYYPELCLPLNRSNFQEIKENSSPEEGNDKDTKDLVTSTKDQSPDLGKKESDATFTTASPRQVSSGKSTNSHKRVAFASADVKSEQVSVPRIERMDVRIPIDIWVSCGEPFIPFEDSERIAIRTSQDREERAGIAGYLEQEKHQLRQLQGRRYAGRASTQQSSPAVKPVLMKVWDQPSKQEETLGKSIEDLQLHLSELKSQQEQERLTEGKNSRPKSAKLLDKMKENKLYDLPRGLSVLVYPNGENSNRALSVIASNMTELLDKATSKLSLNSVARRAFTKDGDEIHDFDEIDKNQLVCVSCGEKFVPNRERRQKIEMRASWSRSHRRSNQATTPSTLALPAPPSPTISRNSPVVRKQKHEETLHVFENNNRSIQSPFPYTTASHSSPRPKSAHPSSNTTVSPRGLPSAKNTSRPKTARPRFFGSKLAVSRTSGSSHGFHTT